MISTGHRLWTKNIYGSELLRSDVDFGSAKLMVALLRYALNDIIRSCELAKAEPLEDSLVPNFRPTCAALSITTTVHYTNHSGQRCQVAISAAILRVRP